MSKITEAAFYRGVVVEHAVGATKEKGLPQLVIKLRALERFDAEEKTWMGWEGRDDNEITAYLVLFDSKKNPIFHTKSIMDVFEWDGVSLVGLETLDLEGAEVQFEVIDHTYKEETNVKVAGIRKYDDEPGSSVKKLDSAELAKLNADFGSALKKLSGGPKTASAKTTTTSATAKTTTTSVTAKTTTAKRGRPKKTTAAPLPPPAPTEVEAVAEATKPVDDLPIGEAIEEFNDSKPATPLTSPPAPPTPPQATPIAEVKDLDLVHQTAWDMCYAKKNKSVSDDQIAAAFSAAQYRQAPGKKETEISGEEWKLIVDVVIGECG